MKMWLTVSAFAVLVLLLGNGLYIVSQARADDNSTSTSSSPGIPAALLAYLTAHRSSSSIMCVAGTLNPFTVTSTTCNNHVTTQGSNASNSAEMLPPPSASSETVSCSTYCAAGTYNYYVGSENWDGWYSTELSVPATPDSTYSSPDSLAYWVGLSNCAGTPKSCSTHTYIIESGIIYGKDGSSSSQHPYMFVNYYDSSNASCDTQYSCGMNANVTSGDTMSVSQVWEPGLSGWDVYAEDTTHSTFVDMTVTAGASGSGYPPNGTSGIPWAVVAMEAYGITAASDYPSGGTTFDYIQGYNNSFSEGVGTSVDFWVGESASGRTAAVDYTTYTCTAGTCGYENIDVT